jgi:hypothetical protein
VKWKTWNTSDEYMVRWAMSGTVFQEIEVERSSSLKNAYLVRLNGTFLFWITAPTPKRALRLARTELLSQARALCAFLESEDK